MTAMSTDRLPAPDGGAQLIGARGIGAWIWSLASVRWAVAALVLMLTAVAAQLADAPQPLWWTLYLAGYLAGGWQSAVSGVQALRDRTLDVDLLMILAAIGAAAIGQVFDGALLIVIFATSGALEDVATARTERSVRGLLDLAPGRRDIARRWRRPPHRRGGVVAAGGPDPHPSRRTDLGRRHRGRRVLGCRPVLDHRRAVAGRETRR